MFSFVNYKRKETWQIDREAKSRSEDRRKVYREFTGVQAVIVYNEIDCLKYVMERLLYIIRSLFR
ncbi:hypothetical protein COL27_14820 [Bacillus sp. AFS075960]|nr:hypothetical protein COL27_14820 [Bacillus sp. AFS075960]PGU96533.1 hypothetical protein COD71_05795 [Bacillus cereus]